MEAVMPAVVAPPPQQSAIGGVVPARLRVDIIIRRQFFKHQEYYVLKDPLALTYCRLQPEEAYILTLLDGKKTLREISQRYSRRYPNEPRSAAEIANYVNQLGMMGLLNISASRFAENASQTAAPHFLMIWAKVISAVFFVKIPLLDPSPWLSEVVHAVRFFWTKWFVGAVLVFYVWTAGLLLANADEFTHRSMDFFSGSNLLLLWFSIMIIKSLHEFGHAMTCRHFGGEVHEMGMCFMCFTPCGYVDASDAWMMRHKRHKLYVTLAGVFTELILAGIAAHFWLILPEGLARGLAFNAMVVASVNTVIFNINPLMRFDGYYVFSDLLEIPNLRTKAITFCSYHLQRILLGVRNQNQEILVEQESQNRVFLVYALFAYGYMLTIIYGLTQIFGRILAPYGLHAFGLSIGYFCEGSFAALPIIKVFLDAANPRAHIIKSGSVRRRMVFLIGGLTALIVGCFYIPSRHHIEQQAVVTPDVYEVVSSEVGGIVKSVHVHTGEWVEAGQLLVTLENSEITAEVEVADAARKQAQLRFSALRYNNSRRVTDSEPRAAQEMEAVEAAYERAKARADNLQIKAHTAGYILTPDVEKLAGSYAIPASQIIRLGDPRQLRLLIPLTEDEAQLVSAGNHVTGRWLATAQRFETTLGNVSSQPAKAGDYQWGMAVHFGGPVPTQQVASRGPANSEYLIFMATAQLPNPGHSVPAGLRVEVKIDGEPTTIGDKMWRGVLTFFRLHGKPKPR
jgi:putative peptide zinc metalloprotease protein